MADAELKIIVPEQYIPLVLESVEFFASKELEISCIEDMSIFKFEYPQKGSASNKSWGEKVLLSMLRALVRMYKLNESNIENKTAIKAIPQPTQNVPDDVVIQESK